MSSYFVFHNRIINSEKMQEYIPKALETMAPFKPEVLVLEENSAMAWYNSPEYQAVRPLRLDSTEGFGVIVDEFVP